MDFLITRDAYGVPHVQAETAADAWAGMGYACAQDRLFQMDYDRRRACGRWAEIAGSPAPGGDVLVNGSNQLVSLLLERGLIDELRLMVFPIVLGTGKRLFAEGIASSSLRLIESRTAGETVILVYVPR